MVFLGEKGKAVITVPAYFNDTLRRPCRPAKSQAWRSFASSTNRQRLRFCLRLERSGEDRRGDTSAAAQLLRLGTRSRRGVVENPPTAIPTSVVTTWTKHRGLADRRVQESQQHRSEQGPAWPCSLKEARKGQDRLSQMMETKSIFRSSPRAPARRFLAGKTDRTRLEQIMAIFSTVP
jgi:hypothetical protein